VEQKNAELIDQPWTVTIRKGIAYCEWPTGERRATPIDVFRKSIAHAVKVLADFDARSGVTRLRSPPTRHG
jgi:hypothetical protein